MLLFHVLGNVLNEFPLFRGGQQKQKLTDRLFMEGNTILSLLFTLMVNRKGLGIFQNHMVKRPGLFQVISIV
jgi:hypothetical protein